MISLSSFVVIGIVLFLVGALVGGIVVMHIIADEREIEELKKQGKIFRSNINDEEEEYEEDGGEDQLQ